MNFSNITPWNKALLEKLVDAQPAEKLTDSWIKVDQLDFTCFIISLFTAQHVSNVSTSIFRSLRLIVDLFHVLYCCGSMCVGVTVWFGWGGVVSLCRLKQCFNHIEPEQYNTRNKSTISRKLLKMDVLTFETCWAVNSGMIKQVTSIWSIYIGLSGGVVDGSVSSAACGCEVNNSLFWMHAVL